MNTSVQLIGRITLAIFFLVGVQSFSFAQEAKKGHSHAKVEIHGGTVSMSKYHHFEAVFKPDGIQVYLYDGLQNPLSAKGVEGEVTLKFRIGEPQKLPLTYVSKNPEMAEEHQKEMTHEHGERKEHADDEADHDMAAGMDYLQAEVDLGKVKAGTMKAIFTLKGLPSEKEGKATFTATFAGFLQEKDSHREHHDAHKH